MYLKGGFSVSQDSSQIPMYMPIWTITTYGCQEYKHYKYPPQKKQWICYDLIYPCTSFPTILYPIFTCMYLEEHDNWPTDQHFITKYFANFQPLHNCSFTTLDNYVWKYSSCFSVPDIPAHDRVVQIFRSRMPMADKCERSPNNLKAFIFFFLNGLCWMARQFA
jgi:hypothetical protein